MSDYPHCKAHDPADENCIACLRADYFAFECDISALYDNLTRGQISKPHTHTKHVLAAVEEREHELVGLMDRLCEAIDRARDGEWAGMEPLVEEARTHV